MVYQQLSGKAAGTIHGRFSDLFTDGQPNAAEAAELSVPELRAVGLSNNKARSILDLAEKTRSGVVPKPGGLYRLSDDALIERLTQVRGIGPWTVQMLLIFYLGRPDVMPATDLGVQKGVQHIYDLPDLPVPEMVLEQTAHLAPYRSAASWYFWRAADVLN